ncbi:hypothetical protein Tco_1420374 [Tanacetum coccineum]
MSESSIENYKGKKIMKEEEPNDEWVNPTSDDNGEKESKALKLNDREKQGSKRAIAYIKLCKTHKVKTMFKLHQITRHNLLRGGNSASRVSSLRSTSGGTDSEAGSGGSGDYSNGNDVGTSDGKCSDDGGGSSDGEGI